MSIRRALAGTLVVLALALAGCGSASTDPSPTTTPAPLTTPDAVAAAFAEALAGGDTPLACTYTSGFAQQKMSQGGSSSLCSRSAWSPQDYWLSDHCTIPGSNGPEYTYVYQTNGKVGGGDSFLVGVTGSGQLYKVTTYAAGSIAQARQICAVAASMLPSTTGPSA